MGVQNSPNSALKWSASSAWSVP